MLCPKISTSWGKLAPTGRRGRQVFAILAAQINFAICRIFDISDDSSHHSHSYWLTEWLNHFYNIDQGGTSCTILQSGMWGFFLFNLWGFLWSQRVKVRPAIGGERALLSHLPSTKADVFSLYHIRSLQKLGRYVSLGKLGLTKFRLGMLLVKKVLANDISCWIKPF